MNDMRVADIILTRSSGISSSANLTGQALVKVAIPKFTHVMVCVSPNVIMDSTFKNGVSLRNSYHEVISGRITAAMCSNKKMMVLRHKDFQGQNLNNGMLKKSSELCLLSADQIYKKYNFKFTIPNKSDTDSTSLEADSAFCSELAAIVLKPLNILPPEWNKPSKTFPVDFEKLEDLPDWSNVTASVSEQLEKISKKANSSDPSVGEDLGLRIADANFNIELIKTYRSETDTMRRFQENIENLTKEQEKLQDVLNKSL